MMQMYLLHQLKQTFVEVHYITISSHLIGLYNASNLYAAITIGKYFEVDENYQEALESYIPENNRSQINQGI
jgi:UDP-N-acetylmuramoyl-tripeptide--D-alanyl-D-alanine ligase